MSYPPLDVHSTLLERHQQAGVLALWQITLSLGVDPAPSPTIFAINYNAPISFFDHLGNAQTYEPWPLSYDSLLETADGSENSLQLGIGMRDPQVMREVESANAIRGMPIYLWIVPEAHIDALSNARPFSFVAESCSATNDTLQVKCSGPNLWDIPLPHLRIDRKRCNAPFKSNRCGYKGAGDKCAQTYAACEAFGDLEVDSLQPRRHPHMIGLRSGMPTTLRAR